MKLRNPLVQFAFIAAVTGPPFGLIMALWLTLYLTAVGRPLPGADGLLYLLAPGLMFGPLFSALMTPLLRDVELTIAVPDRSGFDSRLQHALEKIGYRPAFLGDSFVEIHPGFKAGLLAGSIKLAFSQSEVRVIGPWLHVRKLRNLMT